MKKILITLFQLSVTFAVLYWVYHDPNRRAQMVEAIRNAQYRWVALGILAYMVVEIAAAFRWHVLLKVQKIHLSLPRLSGLFFIGMFYNQFLPGGTGGDIIKSYYLLKETPDKKAGALLAVVFDRFIGLVALVAIPPRSSVCAMIFFRRSPRRGVYCGFSSSSSVRRLPFYFQPSSLADSNSSILCRHTSQAVTN